MIGVGVSAGGSCAQTWHVVVNGGCGVDDGFCEGDPLWVVDHFDDLDWHGLTWCWVSPGVGAWVGMVVAVVETSSGVLHG